MKNQPRIQFMMTTIILVVVTVLTQAFADGGHGDIGHGLNSLGARAALAVPSAAGTCPCSIWSLAATPTQAAVTDGRALEIGVKFRSDVAGYITGMRFYKGTVNTGTHTGTLWSNTGTRLATATFVNETASGWQQVTFSSPVAVQANTIYIASYFSPSGYFAVNIGYFQTGYDNAPLHALASGVAGPNGVYQYDTSGFPTNGTNNNYWVDVVFTTSTTPSPTPTSTPTARPTNTPTPTPTGTSGPTPTNTPTPTATPTRANTPTPGPTSTPTSTPVSVSVPANWFKLGTGYSDVITRQLVRTASDKVYLFCLYSTTSNTILAYWTNTSGIPAGTSSFTGHAQFDAPGQPISVDAVYDGGAIVHVLINVVNPGYDPTNRSKATGTLYDYPFDLTTNSFKPALTISTNNPVRTTLPIGSAGVSGMVGRDGVLNIAYWSSGDHITYVSYTYNPATNTLTQKTAPLQIDTPDIPTGFSNHPTLVISPVNGNITIAWIWQNALSNATDARVYARTRTQSGWGSTARLGQKPDGSYYIPWTDPQDDYTDLGLNVDQGPSMVVTSDGTIHLAYNEAAYTSGGTTQDYGRVHYVTYTPQSGWVDTILVDGLGNYYFTHDPSLTTDSSDQIYLFGHSNWRNSDPCTVSYPAAINCYLKKNANGTWTAPQQVKDRNGNALPPSNPQETFDDSVSMKWGVVGWNRPELVEFAFFSGQASNYWDMSLYYGTLGK